MLGASSGWESAVHSAAEVVSDGGGWSKAKLSTPDSGKGQTLGEAIKLYSFFDRLNSCPALSLSINKCRW